ncbi:MAG: dolichol-phosphate mannosyltransferase [Flavipsychrobacter sp.]|nr:dolichol-phosphate mannosyltransferase [Flavipsychrobacter sp.]
MHITIVLPAYNEEESLPPLLQRINEAYNLYKWDAHVLVVNDGSKDNTLGVARDFKGDIKVEILDIQPNSGLANAINQGIRKAIEGRKDTDIVVTLDADDSQNPFLIQRMMQQVAEGSDLVIASRYQPGARIKGLKRSRKFFSWAAGLLFRVFVGFEGIKDYTCGFRAYRVDMLRKTINYYGDKFITQKGFGCMVELLLKVASQSATMNEVPMILRYDLKQGESKMNVQKTMKQTLKLLFDYKTGRINP